MTTILAKIKNWLLLMLKMVQDPLSPVVGLLEATPLKDMLQAMDIPIVDLSLDFNKLVECPIGTTNVMKPGDDRAWCREHNHGKFPVGTIITPGSWRVSSVGGY